MAAGSDLLATEMPQSASAVVVGDHKMSPSAFRMWTPLICAFLAVAAPPQGLKLYFIVTFIGFFCHRQQSLEGRVSAVVLASTPQIM